ncbi:MAG: hypothetical protein QM682_04040 [Paracoccus sp. (in: a-proteobacteria)]|uniref:hypothetical protein n=1 Tax=Paracoccus sp. TaxID=267 RepID=UPI0039E554EC
MTVEEITELFSRDGLYRCARWGRPVAPVIFGLSDETLDIFRTVTRAALGHAGHLLAETDPEMGANMMTFFLRDWDELDDIPDLDLLTGIQDLPERLRRADADRYRIFRFDAGGGIRACLNFLSMDGPLAEEHPARLAEAVVMRSLLTFSREVAPSRPLAELIRAAYDPVMPVLAIDPTHAMRLAARLGRG